MEANDIEMRAAELVYQRDFGLPVGFSDIPDDDQARILKEIRARALRIEQHVTHDMLDLRINEGRRTPRRHEIVALLALLIVAVTGGIVVGMVELYLHFFAPR